MRIIAVFTCAVALLCLGTEPGHADKRVALVIGNGAYKNAPRLPNPAHDAQDVAAALQRSGFEAIVGVDLDRAGMDDATIRFSRAARAADVALFYYSGHAMQMAGVNYLLPIDAKLTDEADLRRLTRVDEIVADLQQARNFRILVLDSCRDNPLAEDLKRSVGVNRAASIQRGLARADAPQGMIIAYATQAGRTAEDGSGRNSPYTMAFLKHIQAPEEIGIIFRRISADVYQATNHAQLPELSMSLIGEFYLHGKLEVTVAPSNAPPATTQSDPCAAAWDHWRSAEAIGSVAALEDHLARFPNCAFARFAKARIESLKNLAAVSPQVVPSNGWLTRVEYQLLFDKMKSQRRYPRVVEARVFGDSVFFRGTFVRYPNAKFDFASAHGITANVFAERDRTYRAMGYKLIYRQSVKVQDTELFQATWIPK